MKRRRTRIVQVTAILGACALVGLAGYVMPSRTSIAAMRTQDPGQKQGDAPQPQPAAPIPDDGRSQLPPIADANLPKDEAKLPEAEPAGQPSAIAPDPEKDADDFVARTRKEVADRVAALDNEANELRTRLAKVEAASAKLKAAFGAVGEPVLDPVVPRDDAASQGLTKDGEPLPTKEVAPESPRTNDAAPTRQKFRASPKAKG